MLSLHLDFWMFCVISKVHKIQFQYRVSPYYIFWNLEIQKYVNQQRLIFPLCIFIKVNIWRLRFVRIKITPFYFSTPTKMVILQLNWTDLVNLDKLIAEQAPFLQTYAGSNYFDNATAHYIQQEKLQRGTWRISGKKIQ